MILSRYRIIPGIAHHLNSKRGTLTNIEEEKELSRHSLEGRVVLIFVVCNLVVDMLYAALDPRIRYA